jgi:hypothetical protein
MSRSVKSPIADDDGAGRIPAIDDHRHVTPSRHGDRRLMVPARGLHAIHAGKDCQAYKETSQRHGATHVEKPHTHPAAHFVRKIYAECFGATGDAGDG